MIDALPPAKEMLADRGYDADGFRQAQIERGIAATVIFYLNQGVLSLGRDLNKKAINGLILPTYNNKVLCTASIRPNRGIIAREPWGKTE